MGTGGWGVTDRRTDGQTNSLGAVAPGTSSIGEIVSSGSKFAEIIVGTSYFKSDTNRRILKESDITRKNPIFFDANFFR